MVVVFCPALPLNSSLPWWRAVWMDLWDAGLWYLVVSPHYSRAGPATDPNESLLVSCDGRIRRGSQVRNTGNVDLSKITISDPTVLHNCTEVAVLGVGAEHTCSGSHSLTWPDIVSGLKATTAE